MRIQEQQLLVGGQRPQVGRHDLLGGVADRPDVDHGLQPQDAGQLGGLVRVLGVVQLGYGVLDGAHGGLQAGERPDAGGLHGGDDVLLDHVDQALGLDLDGPDVVAVHDVLAAVALVLRQHAHLLEEVDVLGRGDLRDGLDAGVDAPDPALGEGLLHLLAVVVPVEDDPPVLLQDPARDLLGLLALVHGVRELLELLGDDGVEHGVDHGGVLGGPDRAELEPRAPVREGGGAVAVLGGDLERLDLRHAEVDHLRVGDVLPALTVLERLEVRGHVVAEVGGHDGGGGLARAEAEVVPGRGDGHAHQVAVLVHGRAHGGHDDREGVRVLRGLVELRGVQELDAVVGRDAPVVVLPGPVDVVERLLLQQGREAVAGGHLLDDLHDHEVLVDLGRVQPEEGGELVLVGRDLAVAGLEGDADAPALVLHLLHARQRRVRRRRRRHVVVAHLLPAGRVLPDDGPPRELQVRAAVVLVARHEEELLLEADVGYDLAVRHVEPEVLEEADALGVERRVRSEEGRLLVEGRAVVAHERRGDEDGVPP